MPREGKPEHVQKREKAERERWEREQHAESITLLSRIVEQFVRSNEDDEASEPKKIFLDYMTLALVFVTVIITGLTYCVFRQQLGVSQDTEQRQLRAYISATDVGVTPTTDKQGGNLVWHITLKWHNTGATPTRDGVVGLACYLTDEQLRVPIPYGRMSVRRKTIGAGSMEVSGDCAQTPNDITANRARGMTNMLTVVTYKDVFGYPHISEQCVWVDFLGDYTKANPQLQYTVSLCDTKPSHNCEDDECKR